MQKLTVDELKRLLYDTFCEHLSMKDIENIIMTEEESHLGTAEECPVDVESEWPALGLCGWVPVLGGGIYQGLARELLVPSLASLFAPSQAHVPKCRPDSIPSLSPCLSLLFPVGGCSLFQPADPPDVRAQEPDLRLRHRLHHQRHAHRGQPGAAQWHEIGTTECPPGTCSAQAHSTLTAACSPSPSLPLGPLPMGTSSLDTDHPNPHPIGLAWSHGPAVEDLVVALRTALVPIPCLCPHLACM